MADHPETQTNKQRLKEITDGIEQGIKELFQSDRYRQYLSVMSRFHRYSVNNTMLIFMQRPDASLVAGFQKWKNQFGRHVKQGECGITIIAPTPFKKKIEEIKLDPDTKAPLLDQDGKQIVEEKEISIPMFKPVKVFDVSQTDGKPLPELAATLTGSVEQYEVFVEALRRSAPVPISIAPISSNADGYFSPTDQSITIREGMSQVQTVCAMAHEIAHSKLHNYEKQQAAAADGKEGAEIVKKDRNTEEVEAESISYTVCQYYGIQTGDNSFGYIATWSQGKELKELRASLETINKTASGLITDIDRNFAEICRERGIDPKAPPEQEAPAPEPEPVSEPELHKEVPSHDALPDPAITLRMMEQYGYQDQDMLPLSKDRALELAERDVTVYLLYQDGNAEMALDAEEIAQHDGIFGVSRDEWEAIREDVPPRDIEQRFQDNPKDAYVIYQLNENETRDRLFVEYDRLESPPQRECYQPVYTGDLMYAGSTDDKLEGLFQTFNIDRPGDFCGHSLSVSDIVAIKQDGAVSYHYCDSVGFRELPGFNQPENYLKSAEMAMEDDYGMIDGIINNGPRQPTVAELEDQVNAGQTISLLDLANAIQVEKRAAPKAKEERPSIIDRLKQPVPKQANKTAPHRSAEKEI